MEGLLTGLKDLKKTHPLKPGKDSGRPEPGQPGKESEPRAAQTPEDSGKQKKPRPRISSGPRGLQRDLAAGKLDPDDPLSRKSHLSQLNDQEMTRLYGGQRQVMAKLGAARPDISLDDASKMFDVLDFEPTESDAVVEFLGRRRDLSVADCFSTRPDGRPDRLHAAMRDKTSRDALDQRQDLKPAELDRMGNRFQAALGDPMMAAEAYKSSVPLLAKRADLRPEYLNGMMDGMMRTMGTPAATLRAFQNGTRLLSARPDVQPGDTNKLLDSVASLSRKDGDFNSARVGGAFEQATNLLIQDPARSIQDVIHFARLLGNQRQGPSTGGGPTAGAGAPPPGSQQILSFSGAQSPGGKKDRLGLFCEGLDMMRSQPDVDPESVYLSVLSRPRPQLSSGLPLAPVQGPQLA
ncbi:hypothetical protein DYH09_27970 [bacterium CPR1]|nr:hypothetical protein [bacterium CPR1]